MAETVIKIENLSKAYRLGEIGTGTLTQDLNRWWKMNIMGKEDPFSKVGELNDRTAKSKKGELVAVLRDINFEVKQGEIVGIIGKNGAGKSTLLKLLSRVTAPTSGSIKTKGRMASLLEVGTGFHPEMTGRENVYMNGTIMGMRKWEIDKQLDAIIEFAGVQKYIDTPVKRYSSGMTVRLGFAIAAHLEPEILIVDEVLAVGDADFQKKAIGKMQDVSKNGGRTVLFVSHNLAAVRELCTKGVLLNNGEISFIGSVNDTINKYLSSSEVDCKNKKIIFSKTGVEITQILKKQENILSDTVFFNKDFSISIDFRQIEKNVTHTYSILQIINQLGQKVTSINSAEEGYGEFEITNNFQLKLSTDSLTLFPGKYSLNLILYSKLGVELIENIDSFEVLPMQIKDSRWSYNSSHGIAKIFENLQILNG